MLKPAKPPFFDGRDSSVSTVKAWIFSVREYVELSDIDENKQTRYAAGYLTDTAKTWYIDTYGNAAISPDLDTFLNAFKKFYLKTSNENDAAERIETIKQEKLSVSEYATEFKMQLSELGDETDPRWIKRHFLHGLRSKIHIAMAPQISTVNDLDHLIAIAQDTHDALQQAGAYTYDAPTRSYATTNLNATIGPNASTKISTSTRPQRAATPRSYTPTASASSRKRITDEDRAYLRANNGCFWCREINAGHIASDCPEFLVWKAAKDKEAAGSTRVATVSELRVFQVDESSSDSEYPVPSIVLETKLQDTTAKNSLIDCGATVNLVDSNFVQKRHLRTYASHPIRVHQALSPKGAIANPKSVSYQRIGKVLNQRNSSSRAWNITMSFWECLS
jgi:hypothetical protein